MHPAAVGVPYTSGTLFEHLLDDTPLDLAPRRLIAPRRRLRDISTIYRAPVLLLDDDPTNLDDISIPLQNLVSMASDVEQPESPPVIISYF